MWLNTAAGVLALFSNDFDEATRRAGAWEEAARRSGDEYEIAHALILLSSALMSVDQERGLALAEEAIEAARASGIASAILYAIITRTNYPHSDAAYMLDLVAEGLDVARKLGDHSAAGGFVVVRGWIASSAGDWQTALRAAVEGAEEQLQGDVRPWVGVFGISAFALAHLGDLESAAVLRGFAESYAYSGIPEDVARQREEVRTLLVEALGEARVGELATRGAALDQAAAVAFMRTAADRVLDEG